MEHEAMSWGVAAAFFLGLLKMLLNWLGLSQPRALAELEERADEAAEEKRKALDDHPPRLADASAWDRELVRLHNEIAARRE
jgi:hypothetical protein